jgi:hypothetical protein
VNAVMNKPTRPIYPFRLPMDYTDGSDLTIVHDIPVDLTAHVKVVGQPDSGAYEWVIENADSTLTYSNSGYGSPECALRDGLIVFLGALCHSDDVLTAKIEQIMKNARTVSRPLSRQRCDDEPPSPAVRPLGPGHADVPDHPVSRHLR